MTVAWVGSGQVVLKPQIEQGTSFAEEAFVDGFYFYSISDHNTHGMAHHEFSKTVPVDQHDVGRRPLCMVLRLFGKCRSSYEQAFVSPLDV